MRSRGTKLNTARYGDWEITVQEPACLILLVDRSAGMNEITTAGLTGTEVSKAMAATYIANHVLRRAMALREAEARAFVYQVDTRSRRKYLRVWLPIPGDTFMRGMH